MLTRDYDIQSPSPKGMTITIDGEPVTAVAGETVLGVLNAVGIRSIARNDHLQLMGAYCGMGICHSCLVRVDVRYKRRACQTIVRPGMRVETAINRFDKAGQP